MLQSKGIGKCIKHIAGKGFIFPKNQEGLRQERMRMSVRKGHFVVYVDREEKKRFVVPVSYLKHPLFQELLQRAEEAYGYDHRMGGLTVPCTEEYFIDLIKQMKAS